MGLFKWWSEQNQKEIENYLMVLCKETPEVAKELLNTPIRNVSQWMTNLHNLGTNNVEYGVCGCLIGGTLLAAAKVHPEQVKLLSIFPVVDQLYTVLTKIDGDFGGLKQRDFGSIGMAVYNEVYDAVFEPRMFDLDEEWREAIQEREAALTFKIKNIIRNNLGIPQLTKPE